MKIRIGLLMLLFLTSCTSNEIAHSKDVNQDKIYIKYIVHYIEGNSFAKIKAQFRFQSYRGTTLILDEPSSILLDNQKLKAEHDYFSGAYYSASPEIVGFSGNHKFIFISRDRRKYEEDFSFTPFVLIDEKLDSISKKAGLVLSYKGLQEGDILTIGIKDTAEATQNFYETRIIKDGQIIISPQDLQLLKPGPVYITTEKKEIKTLKQATGSEGNIEITYSLKEKRSFLKD